MELSGIHHLTAISAAIDDNHRFYTQTLGMRLVKRSVNQDDASADHLFYADAKGSPGTDLTCFDWPVPRERRGTRSIVRTCLRVKGEAAGGVHHVAFRTPDANYDAWAERLNEFDVPNSGKVDCFWFRTLYVREPNGVLFEIATDGPGFAVDEDPAKLGETVVLPPFLEPYRKQIVANLKPID